MIRSTLLVLIAFSALSLCILLIPLPVGWQFLICVIAFAALMGGFSYYQRHQWPELWQIWYFSTLVSVFQVLPDWFLSAVLGSLVFPEDGLFKFGTVSAYMAGLWAIPFFLILFAVRWSRMGLSSDRWLEQQPDISRVLLAASVTLLIFATSEATLWVLGSWYARDVMMIGHVALYVLIPEFVLGAHLYIAFILSRRLSLWKQTLIAAHVSLLYTGALALSYLFLEKVA